MLAVDEESLSKYSGFFGVLFRLFGNQAKLTEKIKINKTNIDLIKQLILENSQLISTSELRLLSNTTLIGSLERSLRISKKIGLI